MRIVLPHRIRDAYWDFADYIHSNQATVNKEGSKDNQFAALDRITLSEGDKFKLDAAKLQSCVKGQKSDAVKASVKEGDALGVTGTPTMFVNGQMMDGARSVAEIRELFDSALQRAGVSSPGRQQRRPPQLPHLLHPRVRPRRSTDSFEIGGSLHLSRSRAWFVLALSLFSGAFTACTMKPSGDDVVATVDGQKIYRADLEKYFQSQTAGSNQPLSDEQATSLRLSILHQLIENEILMHRAEKLGLLATDDEVDRKLNEIKSPYTNEEFAQRLQERKISLDDFKRDIRRALTADKVLHKEVTSKINVTPAGHYRLLQRTQSGVQPD